MTGHAKKIIIFKVYSKSQMCGALTRKHRSLYLRFVPYYYHLSYISCLQVFQWHFAEIKLAKIGSNLENNQNSNYTENPKLNWTSNSLQIKNLNCASGSPTVNSFHKVHTTISHSYKFRDLTKPLCLGSFWANPVHWSENKYNYLT